MAYSQFYVWPVETETTCNSPQGHMLCNTLLKQVKDVMGTYHSTTLIPLTFMSPFWKAAFLFSSLGCLGTCLCCDNQGWLSWISYTVELNFPFELLTSPNVLESVISFAESSVFGNVGSFSTLLFCQHSADLITLVIGNLERQRDVKPILC